MSEWTLTRALTFVDYEFFGIKCLKRRKEERTTFFFLFSALFPWNNSLPMDLNNSLANFSFSSLTISTHFFGCGK